jgi:hypothetical protein
MIMGLFDKLFVRRPGWTEDDKRKLSFAWRDSLICQRGADTLPIGGCAVSQATAHGLLTNLLDDDMLGVCTLKAVSHVQQALQTHRPVEVGCRDERVCFVINVFPFGPEMLVKHFGTKLAGFSTGTGYIETVGGWVYSTPALKQHPELEFLCHVMFGVDGHTPWSTFGFFTTSRTETETSLRVWPLVALTVEEKRFLKLG